MAIYGNIIVILCWYYGDKIITTKKTRSKTGDDHGSWYQGTSDAATMETKDESLRTVGLRDVAGWRFQLGEPSGNGMGFAIWIGHGWPEGFLWYEICLNHVQVQIYPLSTPVCLAFHQLAYLGPHFLGMSLVFLAKNLYVWLWEAPLENN